MSFIFNENVRAVVIESTMLKFYTVILWDNKKHTPSFIKNKGFAHSFLDRLFGIHCVKLERSSNKYFYAKEDIDLTRTTYRRFYANRFRESLGTLKELKDSIITTNVHEFSNVGELKRFIDLLSENNKKSKCVGVFYNSDEDLEDFYMSEQKKRLKPFNVLNAEIGLSNVLVIKDNSSDAMLMFPWRAKADFSKRRLLDGDKVFFKKLLLELSQVSYSNLGKEKEVKKNLWLKEIFFKLINEEEIDLIIENYPVYSGSCLSDTVKTCVEIITKEGSEKLLNFPTFGNKNDAQELYAIIDMTTVQRGSLLHPLLTVKSFKDLTFENDGPKKDFSSIGDTSYSRPCNSSTETYSMA